MSPCHFAALHSGFCSQSVNLNEVATAVSSVNGKSRQELYDALVSSAKRKTSTADMLFGEDGKPIGEENFGENVIVVV